MSNFYTMLWTVACQALLSMGFSKQEHWSGLPCLPPGDLPDPGIEPLSLMSPALAGGLFTTSATCYTLHTNSFSVPSSSKAPLVPQLPTSQPANPVFISVEETPVLPIFCRILGMMLCPILLVWWWNSGEDRMQVMKAHCLFWGPSRGHSWR